MKILSLIILLQLIISSFFLISVAANSAPVGQVPSECPDTYVVDFECVRKKLLDPEAVCNENVCLGQQGGQITDDIDEFDELEVFGAKFYINSTDRIAAVINIGISTFLGIVSLYALIRGVYVGGFKIAGTTDAEQIATGQKELVQLVIAFAIAWSAILILQFVFSLLGLGSINDYVLVGDQAGNTNIIIN